MSSSLEAALDEERKLVLELIEGKKPSSSRYAQSQQSPHSRTASPQGVAHSPIRSMLDVDSPDPPRNASIAGQGVGVTPAGHAQPLPIRSMLDTTTPHTQFIPRSAPRFTTSPPPVSPAKPDPIKEYNFEIQPSGGPNVLPKRAAMGGKKQKGGISALFGGGRQSSPSSRGPARSKSPGSRSLSQKSSLTTPNIYISDTGQHIDLSNAYRRMSDAALLRSGSSLASLPSRKGSDPKRGEELAPDGTVRLTKDFNPNEKDSSDEAVTDSSDEEGQSERRGRDRTRKLKEPEDEVDENGNKREVRSLLAAAEEERKPIRTGAMALRY